MTSNTTDLNLISKAIEYGVKAKISEIVEAQIKDAQDEIAFKLRGEIDKIALSLCSEYSVERCGTDITIVVRKAI